MGLVYNKLGRLSGHFPPTAEEERAVAKRISKIHATRNYISGSIPIRDPVEILKLKVRALEDRINILENQSQNRHNNRY